MIQFTRAIYADLLSRVKKMINRIKWMEHHPDIRDDFVQETLEVLHDLEFRVRGVIDAGDLEIDFLLANNLSSYSKFNQDLGYIELFRVQPINNYGIGEHFFKKLVEKVYDDANLLSSPPLVSTISNSDNYYWAVPYENIIAVPFWEEENLINLPDLYHEIGHLIVGQYYETLIGKFHREIEQHYQAEIDLAKNDRRNGDVEILSETRIYWLDSWFEEFVCDLIATYLTGTAFAWTNMKLTTISHSKAQVYQYSKSHPSDAARTKAIIFMLKRIGINEGADNIQTIWDAFEQLINYPKMDCYDIIFSEILLEKLTGLIFSFCNDIDLRKYKPIEPGKDKLISHWLNEAWEISRSQGVDFQTWERDSILRLTSILGIG